MLKNNKYVCSQHQKKNLNKNFKLENIKKFKSDHLIIKQRKKI
jgi:hypothetical protein